MWRERVYQNQSTKRAKKIAFVAKLLFLVLIAFFLLSFVALPLIAITLPSPENIEAKSGFSTKILDRNGETLYDIYQDKKRTPVKLADTAMYLRQATVSIEDKNFYSHQGFDPTGMLRALVNIFVKRRLEGGSTLTQQLVKIVLLTPERNIFRKVKEFILAVELERKYSKDKILEFYLNDVSYGGNTIGVETAAEAYFDKKASDLTLAESVILAGMPQRPSVYSPYSTTPKAYIGRAEEVLRRMREDGFITPDQEKLAKAELPNTVFQPRNATFKAPHFVQYVQKLLEDRYGVDVVEAGGLKITTTLDNKLQEKAQSIVSEEISKVEKQRITNGGVVVLSPETGEILAMVGSKNFNDPNYDGQVNVTTSLRQPGSSFKPFTYVTAFKKGFTPSSLVMDVQTTFPGGVGQPDYVPVNYDGKFKGPIQIRYALGNSINIPAVKVMALVGIKDVLQTATDMGITTLPPTAETLRRVGLSLTLGGGEVRLLDLTSAYDPFMNGGFRTDPIAILRVEDKNGKVLEEVYPQKGKRVITPQQAFLINNILSDNEARRVVFGSNSLLNIPNVAVKTGTTNNKRDNWTVGGNGRMVVGVWVGNNDNTPMLNVASGVSGASPIWRRVLTESLKNQPAFQFEIPDGVIRIDVDQVSGYAAHDGFPTRSEYFIKGTESGEDPVHVKLKVCKSDGRIATPSDIASNNYDEKEFFVFKEDDPTAGVGGPNKWQEGISAWLSSQSDPRYHPPTDYCGTANPVNVDFVNPGDRSSNLPNDFLIKVRADSTSDISQVELSVDGTVVRTFTSLPYEYQISLTNGVHTIRAKATDAGGHQSDRTITIGVNVAWDYNPTSLPSPTPTATP
ncbi:PBP1A family penicillin-binding protein [Candidatus Woesebacteria bacterium]|nr:PBP1A family penicillin-binding protein [Candidatus Woesebacteria bacterium]